MLCLVPPPPQKGSNSHHRPVDHTGLQQNVFIDEENVSPVLDNVKEKNNSIMRGHLLVGGCATQRENCLSNNVKTPPPSLFCFEFFHSEHLFYNIQANIYVISWKGTAGNVIISLCRCFFDPLHPFLGHRGDAIVLHGTCLGPVQPWRGSYSLENMPRL